MVVRELILGVDLATAEVGARGLVDFTGNPAACLLKRL